MGYPRREMAKKGPKHDASTPSPASALKHNPFAALGEKRADLPAQAASPEPVPNATGSGATSSGATSNRATTNSATSSGATSGGATSERASKSRGRLVLRRETKHRGGKPVVIVRGFAALREFALPAPLLEQLAKELKQKLGCGGTVERDAEEPQIVLQGDHPAKVAELLRAKGFRVDGVTS